VAALPDSTDYHFFEDTFGRLNGNLATYVSDVAGNVIGAISDVAYTLLLIYMMLWGWMMLRGMISEPIIDGTVRIVRLTVIVSLALNLGLYNAYISDFLWSAPDALAAHIAAGHSASSSNVNFLDKLMSDIFDLGVAFWQMGQARTGLPDFGMLMVALLIFIAGMLATGYAAFLLAMAKMALAVLLAIGPLFVLLLMFEGTKRFFEAWIGQAINYVFLVVLTAAAIKLVMTIIQAYLLASGNVALDPTIDKAVPCIVLCIIAFLVMVQVPTMASALGGGSAISTLGVPSLAFSKAKDALSAMRPTSLRRSLNRVRSDVRIAAGAAKATAAAPMAVYRKITGQTPRRTARR
jgi:type IV secretion system protein VirB6